MKLYDCKGAVNPRRVDIFLAEKGIDIDRVRVDVFKGEHRSEEFRILNPSCAVPFLELDDGVVISESAAISRYFEEQKPQPPLMGETPQEQACISMWQRRVEDGLLYAAQHFFHHATPGLGEPDRYRNADWGQANKTRVYRNHALDRSRTCRAPLYRRRGLHHRRHHGAMRNRLRRQPRHRHA
jgi:glutathione S-transferase